MRLAGPRDAMPTYEYECEKCGHRFERFQSMTDDPVKRCPECRCKVRRLLGTGSGIIFKGSGFYETDYRSSDYKEKAKKETSTAAPSSETKGESKSESKSEGASEGKKEGKKEDKKAAAPEKAKSAKSD